MMRHHGPTDGKCEWRSVADALYMVLRKNGVGGRQWQAAMDLYEEASAPEAGGDAK